VNREIVGCSEYRHWGRPSIEGSVPHMAIDFAADLKRLRNRDLIDHRDVGIAEQTPLTAEERYHL
jgi:hypothetical protein